MSVCRGTSPRHQNAMRLVAYLAENDGCTMLTTAEVADHLGISWLEASRAKRHLRRDDCADLRRMVLAYRSDDGQVLLDPTGTLRLGDLRERGRVAASGVNARQRRHDHERAHMVRTYQAIADEAQARNDAATARLYERAATELDISGAVQPATAQAIAELVLA